MVGISQSMEGSKDLHPGASQTLFGKGPEHHDSEAGLCWSSHPVEPTTSLLSSHWDCSTIAEARLRTGLGLKTASCEGERDYFESRAVYRSVATAGHAGGLAELRIFSTGARTCFTRHSWGLSLPLLAAMLSLAGPAWGLLPNPSPPMG